MIGLETTVAIVEAQGQDFGFDEVQLDGPRADEVLIRIVATGLCHTDLTLRSILPAEMYPHVFGHEGAGVVEGRFDLDDLAHLPVHRDQPRRRRPRGRRGRQGGPPVVRRQGRQPRSHPTAATGLSQVNALVLGFRS